MIKKSFKLKSNDPFIHDFTRELCLLDFATKYWNQIDCHTRDSPYIV